MQLTGADGHVPVAGQTPPTGTGFVAVWDNPHPPTAPLFVHQAVHPPVYTHTLNVPPVVTEQPFVPAVQVHVPPTLTTHPVGGAHAGHAPGAGQT